MPLKMIFIVKETAIEINIPLLKHKKTLPEKLLRAFEP